MSSHLAKIGVRRYGGRPAIRLSALSTLGIWLARSIERRALWELAEDARLLADVGLNRQEALREAAKPFWRQ